MPQNNNNTTNDNGTSLFSGLANFFGNVWNGTDAAATTTDAAATTTDAAATTTAAPAVPVSITDKIAQLNAKYQHGNTALHLAIKRNNMEDFGKLVNNPLVDIDAVNENGQTPLHFVAFKGNHQAAATLIHFGANPNVKDVNGQSAKDYAEKNAGRSADHAKTLELIKQDYVAKGLVKSGTIFVDSECNIVESFGLTPNSKQATATVVALDKDGNAVSELRFTTGKAGEFKKVLNNIETDSKGKAVAKALSIENVRETVSALRADDYLNAEEQATLDFFSQCEEIDIAGAALELSADII